MQNLKILRSILVLGVSMAAFSCNKKLDVFPQNNITPDQIQTAEDVKATLFGSYSLLQGPNAFGERWLFAADLLADEGQVEFVGTFVDHGDLTTKKTLTTNGIANGIWSNGYTLINVINTVLDKIDLVTENDERNTLEGEAKFIRGVTYYYLVNFFGQPYSDGNANTNLGVPLMLAPVYAYDSTEHKVSRATVAQVYTQIIADLTEAASKLPDESEDFRANKASAQAFLARVYMAQGDYAAAATQADNVIASPLYALNTSFFNAFNNESNSAEDIFAIQQTSQSNSGTSNNGIITFYAARPQGRGDAQIPEDYYVDNFEATDDRGAFAYIGNSIGGQPGIYTGKWMERYKAIPIVRLAEMYLTRGEANARGGTSIGADPIDDINTVRARAGASLYAVDPGPDDFVEERFRELAFEGDRLWTLKRAKMDVDGLPYNHQKLVLPIPQREIDVNKNLVQNPGYF